MRYSAYSVHSRCSPHGRWINGGAHGKDEDKEHPAAEDHRTHLSKNLGEKAKGYGSPSVRVLVGTAASWGRL